MKGWLFVLVGILLLLLGGVWTLQGVGIIEGSAMSDVTFWAVVGPIVAVLGIVLMALGVRRMRAPRADSAVGG
jgi:hypothetical protein